MRAGGCRCVAAPAGLFTPSHWPAPSPQSLMLQIRLGPENRRLSHSPCAAAAAGPGILLREACLRRPAAPRCVPPAPRGAGSLDGPRRRGEATRLPALRQQGLLLAASPLLPGRAAGHRAQPRRGNGSLCRCSATPRFDNSIWACWRQIRWGPGWGWTDSLRRQRDHPNPQLRDGGGTWAQGASRWVWGTWRPEGGFLPGSFPDSCQGWGVAGPLAGEASAFPAQCPSQEGLPAPGAGAQQHPASLASRGRGQRPVLFGATVACHLVGVAGDVHCGHWSPSAPQSPAPERVLAVGTEAGVTFGFRFPRFPPCTPSSSGL